MNVEVVQRRLWKPSQQHRKHHQPQWIATAYDRVLSDPRSRQSGKPDVWKLARPVWGWGGGCNSPRLHHVCLMYCGLIQEESCCKMPY
jgi:hypothetical protein